MSDLRDSFGPIMRWFVSICALGGVVVTALGCGGASFDGHVYRADKYAFRVPTVPDAWRPIEVTGAALAFRDEAEGTIAVNGRCGMDGDDVPLAALTQHLFFQFTDREIKEQETVPFDGREAMRSLIEAKLDGVPYTFEVWVLKKDSCVYDLYYFAPPAAFEQHRGRFDAFARGFATVER